MSITQYRNYVTTYGMNTFSERLRAEIEYSGLLQKEVAYRAGIKKRALDMYLGAQGSMPPADVAVRIANVLDVSVEYLVSGDEDSNGEKLSPQVAHLLESAKSLSQFDIETVQLLVDRLRNHG